MTENHRDQWRSTLDRDGQLTLGSSRRFGALVAAFFTGSLIVGVTMVDAGDITGVLVAAFSACFVAFGVRTAATGRPAVKITSAALHAYGTSLAWSDVLEVSINRHGARRGVELWCTDGATATFFEAASPWYRWSSRLDRMDGFGNRVGLPATLAADTDQLALWLNELAAVNKGPRQPESSATP